MRRAAEVQATRRVLLTVMALSLACGGCGARWQSALDPQGSASDHLYDLTLFLTVACGIIWLLVVGLAVATLRRRRVSFTADPALPDPRRERRFTIITSTAVVVTALIVTVFTVASFLTTRHINARSDDAVVVRVRGYQWWWEFTYLADKPDQIITTANEVHVPVGRSVRFVLEAPDVIHSFWVPSLAGKQDLIPGLNNEVTIRPERAGVYRGQCAEFCGLQHAHMAFLVIADAPDVFARWQAAQRQPAVEPSSEEEAAGRTVFLTEQCRACHTIQGTSAAGTVGPDLTHVAGRRTIAAGLLPTTRGSLAAWIADPQTIKPGNNMPMVPLSGDELRAVSAYMASLK